jgi:ABC-2 type transport system permease protein
VNLVRAELNRFFSRRFVRLMLVLLMAAFVLTVLVVLDKSKVPTDEMWASARVGAENMQRQRQLDYSSCMKIYADTDPARCERFNPERVTIEDYLWGVFNFAREIEDLVYFLAAFLTFFGLLVSASFIGSELHSGGMINLLLWRPNRLRVLGAKLVAALGAIAVISLIFSALYVGTFYGLAVTTGWVGDTGAPGFWSDLVLLCLRGIGFTLIMSTLAFAIATIGRHTAAALGALFGYLVLWEAGARIIVETLTIPGNPSRDDWFLSTYVEAWFSGRDTVLETCTGCPIRMAFSQSALVFAALVAVLTPTAFATFRRRDLT